MSNDAVELFAGIGGFRVAADEVGFRTIFANDNSAKACRVYRHRFGDVTEGDIVILRSLIPPHNLLTAGIPCQPFSNAGKKQGIRDPRGTLFQVVVDVLKSRSPDCFVIENVKRLLSMESGSHFATILSALASLDYAIEWRLLNALDFGLAQNRQRVVIIGTRRAAGSGPISYLAPGGDLSSSDIRNPGSIFDVQTWGDIERHGKRFKTWGMAFDGRFIESDLAEFSEALPARFLRDILQNEVSPEYYFTKSTLERIESSDAINRYFQGVEILYSQSGGGSNGLHGVRNQRRRADRYVHGQQAL